MIVMSRNQYPYPSRGSWVGIIGRGRVGWGGVGYRGKVRFWVGIMGKREGRLRRRGKGR